MALILHVTPRSCVVAHDDRASDILRRPPRSIEREEPAARGAGRISGLPRPLCGLAMTYLLRHRHCEEPQATKQSSAAALSTCQAGSFRRDAADISQHVFRASDENIVNSVVWRDTGVSADGRIRNAVDPPSTWRRLRPQAVTGRSARAAVW